MKVLSKDDVLDALIVDLVANQVIRALDFGYSIVEVEAAALRGVDHGIRDHAEKQSAGR